MFDNYVILPFLKLTHNSIVEGLHPDV